jgi:glycosyltransferase involved in cell wall biosynthesis
MKILIIAMSESIHTARWISQITDQGWDVHLFSSIDCGLIHPEIKGITAHIPIYGKRRNDGSLRVQGLPVYNDFLSRGLNFVMRMAGKYFNLQRKRLIRAIEKINPDIVHSLEIQHAGYLTLDAKKHFHGKFPPWIVTNWGSDIYLFGRFPEHELKIREVLAACDYYSCECHRDVDLARSYGFMGKVLPVFPNAGGFNLSEVAELRQPGPAAGRRLVMLKGYQHWAGRALVGLQALERCKDDLKGYQIIIYSASPEVVAAARIFRKKTGIPVKIIPKQTPHRDILALHGQARISIGLSIGDGISTSFLEAFVMGSFPIQSWTSCADEWIEDGVTGILVPPDDPEMIEQAIRRALTDDRMVNDAAAMNHKRTVEMLDLSSLKKEAVGIYTTALSGKDIRSAT